MRNRLSGVILPICVSTVFTAGSLLAQAPAYREQVEQWGMQEVVLHSARTYSNPVLDVKLQGRFSSGTKEVVADGFYDGQGTWKVRLMPEVQGSWNFTTTSNDPDLNQKTGSFKVGAPSAGNHGPVRVRDTFGYADGTGYFPLGTTDYGGVGGETSNQVRTVSKLMNSPLNKTRFMLLGGERAAPGAQVGNVSDLGGGGRGR